MIPKVIHYCWFGKKPLSDMAKKCINSWIKYCPDYKIMAWNEDNFDESSNTYVREAYDVGKYAFVSDYVRLYALYIYGGVYLDTDVEVVKSLDEFLSNKAFSGYEKDDQVQTSVLAAEKETPIIQKWLSYYENRPFIKEDKSLDMTTNVDIITSQLIAEGLLPNGQRQTVCDFTVYPQDFFSPKSLQTFEVNVTENTACIHHFDGSWMSKAERIELKRAAYCRRHYGKFADVGFKFHHFILRPWNIIRWAKNKTKPK